MKKELWNPCIICYFLENNIDRLILSTYFNFISGIGLEKMEGNSPQWGQIS